MELRTALEIFTPKVSARIARKDWTYSHFRNLRFDQTELHNNLGRLLFSSALAIVSPSLVRNRQTMETAEDKGPEKYSKLDTSEAEKQLGLKFKGWEQTLEESLQSLLKLKKTEGWN